MTPAQTTQLTDAYVARAKIKVHMAANPDNVIVQGFGGFMFGLANRVIERFENKHGKLLP